ncbi:MAG: tetratricopeptide (TPR) repeat protein [Hyphomicrobiaceae bacterium]|jgi:tetratricopeptide (TPR) repeat protein
MRASSSTVRMPATVATVAIVAVVGLCVTSCGRSVLTPSPQPAQQPSIDTVLLEPGRIVRPVRAPQRPRPVAVTNWEAFAHSSAGLDRRVRDVATDLASAAPRHPPAELASLRLSQRARDLIDAGRPETAVDLLERAIAMYGRDGFAYLYLAYAHHQLGRPAIASGFAGRAEQALPANRFILGELAGLRASIRANSVLPALD